MNFNRQEVVKFLPARNYASASGRGMDLIVLHSAEAPEKPGKAWAVARWFAGQDAPKASAHYVVDSAEIVQCVPDGDIAWAAPGANRNGIHIELVGYARQLAEDWEDVYSASMLDLAGRLTAALCASYNIPPKLVDVAGLLAGDRGVTTHAMVTAAFKKSTHTDPGSSFPLTRFIQHVGELVESWK